MKDQEVRPQFGGFEFTISRLDPGILQPGQYGYTRFGYNIKSRNHQEGAGAWFTIEDATRACLARIETLIFDGRREQEK